MKHKRIHAKITEHLEQNGDATTGQIQDWVKELRPTRKNRAKGAGFMTSQSLNVLSNVLRRKPIVKVDSTTKSIRLYGESGTLTESTR